jgi:hypothetical protein
MAFILTRIDVGDYEAWKRLFDQDVPRARADAKGYRIFRSLENPGEVFIQIEFASAGDATTARDRLVASGVLDRFADKSGPTVVVEAEAVSS